VCGEVVEASERVDDLLAGHGGQASGPPAVPRNGYWPVVEVTAPGAEVLVVFGFGAFWQSCVM